MPTLNASTVTDWITAVSGLILALATVAIACIAWLGLVRWLKHIRDRSRFKAARTLVRNALTVRDALRFVRNPWSTEAIRNPVREGNTGMPRQSPELDGQHQQIIERQNRFRSFVVAYRRLEGTMVEAEAISIDVEMIRPHQRELLGLGDQVGTALTICEGWYRTRCGRDLMEDESKQLAEAEETTFDRSKLDSPDSFDKRLQAAVSGFISPLKKYLGTDSDSSKKTVAPPNE
jgi:hypothetical protein